MKKYVSIFLITFSFFACRKIDLFNEPVEESLLNNGITITDIDGNVYHTVTIGTQTWMVENLKTTKYRNGEDIPNVKDNTAWSYLSTGAYCDYNNYEPDAAINGKLYNWYAVNDSRKIAPEGWHVPTDAEWATLTKFLGGETVAGGKLKEAGTYNWTSPNTGATNETGFKALPGGDRRSNNGLFGNIDNYGSWWSSTGYNTNSAYFWYLYYDYCGITKNATNRRMGLSVRLIMD